MNAYQTLIDKAKTIQIIASAAGALQWDFETYMPPKGMMLRGEQLSYLTKTAHEMTTDPSVGKLLDEISHSSKKLNEVQKRNVALTRLAYDKLTKVPSDLVAEIAKQAAISTATWKKAKAARAWKMFEPELKKLIDLSKKRAQHVVDAVGFKSAYDAMIDDFERGMTTESITAVFRELRDGLVPLVKKCAEASKDVDSGFASRKVPIDIQRKIAADLCDFIEYDTKSPEAGGRVDETEHPFTTGYFDDVRITTHYHEDNVFAAFYSVLHEGGHALYEQGFDPAFKFQPIGAAASSGIHESMSRFIENIVARSPEFWHYYYPRFIELTGSTFKDIKEGSILEAVNIVRPSKIRIEADEVTYSLHVIIRFEIERDLFADRIDVEDLPQIWNEKYEKYLGVEIDNDSEGVMQDTHWASGYYGYFPSYALGNVYDGMWLTKLERDLADWRSGIAQGKFGMTKKWLTDHVYRKASMYDASELLRLATGKSLTAKPFLDYLSMKYSKLFGF